MNIWNLRIPALTCATLAATLPLANAQREKDGVVSYPGGYTIEQGVPFELPPPVADAGKASATLILNGAEPEVSAPFIGGGPTQRLLDLAGGAGGYVAAWNDTRDGNAALFVGFLDPSGEHPRDGAPVHHPRSSRQLYPNLELLDGTDDQPVRGGIVWGANEMSGLFAKTRYFVGPRDWPEENVERASAAFLIDDPKPVAELTKGARPNLALAGDLGIVAWTAAGALGAYSLEINPQTRRYDYRDKVVIAPKADPQGGAFELSMNKAADVMAAWSEGRGGTPLVRVATVNLHDPRTATQADLGPGKALDLAAAENGNFWLLVQGANELQLVTLDRTGKPLPGAPLVAVVGGQVGEARLTTWGGGVGAAVLVSKNVSPPTRGNAPPAAEKNEVKLHVFAANGKRVTPAAGIEALDKAAVDPRDVHVAARGNDFLVAWTDSRHDRSDIYYRLLNLDALDAPARRWNRDTEAADQAHASVATHGKDALVAWDDMRRGDTEIVVRAVHLDREDELVLGAETLLNEAPTGPQAFPAIALGARTGYVVWKENRAGQWIVRGQALDTNGRPTAKAQDLDAGQTANNSFPAALTALPGSGGFVAAWIRVDQGPMVVRLDKDGTPMGTPRPVSTRPINGAMRPTIALGDDNRLLVAWDQPGNAKPQPGDRNGPPAVIVGHFVTPDGSPTGTPIYFPPSPEGGDIDPNLTARTGGGYLLAWTGNDSPTRDVYARVLDADGNSAAAPMGISVRYHEQDYAETTTLEDGRVLVAWEDDISGRDHCFVRAVEVTGRGGGVRVTMGPRYLINDVDTVFVEDRHAPVLAPFGKGVLLVWDDLARGKGHDIAARYAEL